MKNINDTFATFAACFVGTRQGDGEILHPDRLERAKLNYSLESLAIVDDYLDYVHQHWQGQMELGLIKSMLWGGAYLGEVIRRNAPRAFNWIDYDDFVVDRPETKEELGDEKQLASCAVLTAGDVFTLPINELLRLLHEGPGNSLLDYARRGVMTEKTGDRD